MKNAEMNIEEIKKKVLPILKKYGVKRAGIFGSVVRGEAREDSDVDILVRFDESRGGLFEFIGTKLDLEDELGKKVDLVEMGALRKQFQPYVDQDKIRIL